MLLRVGIMFMVTGIAFIAMGWLDPVGPLLIIFGSALAAVALEARLNIQDWEQQTATAMQDMVSSEPGHRAA